MTNRDQQTKHNISVYPLVDTRSNYSLPINGNRNQNVVPPISLNGVAKGKTQTQYNVGKTLVNDGQGLKTDSQGEKDKNKTCVEKIKAQKCLYFSIFGGVLVLIILAIVLPIVLTGKDDQVIIVDPPLNPNQNKTIPQPPQPPIITEQPCDKFPDECKGVPQNVNNYIFQNYKDLNQARSLLQVSRSLNLLNTNSSSNSTRQNLIEVYRNISRSIECLLFTLPNNYTQVYQKIIQLQLSTQQELQRYLIMTESFSGQPLRIVSQDNLAQACRFDLSSSRRRMLQQQPVTPQNTTNTTNTTTCYSDATSVLIYYSGIGYSPIATIQNLYEMQQILSTNASTNFGAGIIALGTYRIDSQLGFVLNLVRRYQSYLSSQGLPVPGRYYLYSALIAILNQCRKKECLLAQISVDLFMDFWKFYVQKSVLSIIYKESEYHLGRHTNFVLQQLREGKTVVLMAHGQGSLQANRIYYSLDETDKQSVKLIYVAPTVTDMADASANYITNPNDDIISSIRTKYQTNPDITIPKDPNMAAKVFDSQSYFGSNHELPGYANAYKKQLTNLIIAAKTAVIQPVKTMGNGPITIFFTWDIQPDIDLHIIEPDKTHVYFYYRKGKSGQLDVDDVQSYGPQHYYTNCNPMPGNYTVYLNYYSGTVASSTFTTVSAGSQFFMKSVTINPDKNVSICTIGVEYNNKTSTYSYTIYPAE